MTELAVHTTILKDIDPVRRVLVANTLPAIMLSVFVMLQAYSTKISGWATVQVDVESQCIRAYVGTSIEGSRV